MKHIIAIATLMICGAAQAAPVPQERKEIGNISYYMAPDEKTIFVELPVNADFSLAEIDADNNMVTAAIRRQTSLDRPEIATLRAENPGYAISSYDDSARVRSARVVLPGGREMELTNVRSNEVILDGMLLLPKVDFDNLRARLKKGERPLVQLALVRTVPGTVEVERITVPSGEICENLRTSLPAEMPATTAIAKITSRLKNLISSAAYTSSIESMFERVLGQCLEVRGFKESREVSSLLELPVRFNHLDRKSQFSIVKTRSETLRRESPANVEIKVGGDL